MEPHDPTIVNDVAVGTPNRDSISFHLVLAGKLAAGLYLLLLPTTGSKVYRFAGIVGISFKLMRNKYYKMFELS